LAENFHALVRGDRKGPWPLLQRGGLRLLSIPYGLAVRLRNWLFDHGWKQSYRAPVPVISVGNLTVGGTGKTPCVEYVARCYRERGLRVAVLSRGYGSDTGRNDEALVLEENLPDVPHLQGPDRAELARVAVEELESEVLVLDDGFQHRRLARDLDLVLIDATLPWGHGYLLPRGLLREPRSSLRRASVVLLTRCDQVKAEEVQTIRQQIERQAPATLIAESIHEPAAWRNAQGQTLPPTGLQGRPVAGFCGLGNPEAFRRTLQKLGLEVIAWRTFPDHHPYTRDDIEDLRRWAREQPPQAVMATTQKDLVKIRLERLGDRELWALQIQLHVLAGKEAMENKLLGATLFANERISFD
jgi:tetraacyldisaccharide 4'-kinase